MDTRFESIIYMDHAGLRKKEVTVHLCSKTNIKGGHLALVPMEDMEFPCNWEWKGEGNYPQN